MEKNIHKAKHYVAQDWVGIIDWVLKHMNLSGIIFMP